MAELFSKLKALRVKAGLRQAQVASYLGVDQTLISKMETGERNISVDQLEKILALYGYDLNTFDACDAAHLRPLNIAFRAQDVQAEDLHALAEISKIALNSQFMEALLEGQDD